MTHSFFSRRAQTTTAWLMGAVGVAAFSIGASAQDQIPADASSKHKVHILQQEITQGITERKQTAAYDAYRAWTADRLDNSAGERTWSDKTGNARLDWVDKLLREPVWALGEAESFTRQMYENAQDEKQGVVKIVAEARSKLDAADHDASQLKIDVKQPMESVTRVLENVTLNVKRSMAPLKADEQAYLREHLYDVTTARLKRAHSYPSKSQGRKLTDLLEKMDRSALLDAGHALAMLTDASVLDALAGHAFTADAKAGRIPGVTGSILQRIPTEHGDILIGSKEDNTYELDEMQGVAVIIDVGGNDTWLEGTLSEARPVLMIFDLAGDDTYRATKPGVQGAAIMGVSLLVDIVGSNTYHAHDVAQGAALAGVGILLDTGGDTTYVGRKRVQGSAIAGVGLLLDRKGNDSYRAALLAQGVGGSLGMGLAIDTQGDNTFYAGGIIPGSYNDSPGYDAWSQGVGTGPRGIANGGIGALLVGPGNDTYECDYFSHGGGYWFAAGFARDFGGNDQRLGATRTQFDGSERTEKRFLRWSTGYQAHYGAGFVIDDAGDDTYQANTASIGFSWDIGVAAVMDLQGNDQYINARSGGSEAAFGVLYDAQGDDIYKAGSPGYAREQIKYHPMPQAGANFSFLIDYGGKNQFPDNLPDNTQHQRGAITGFLISRNVMPPLTTAADAPPAVTQEPAQP